MNRVYCCFPGGKHKALTMSYDDGRTQDRRLIDIFNQNGIKGTFHLNSGLFDRGDRVLPEEIPDLYKGHEVAVHTVNHARLKSLSDDEIVKEVMDDIKNLEELVEYEVRGMAYPYNEVDDRVLRIIRERTPIKYARTTHATFGMDLQKELLLFKPSCRYGDEEMYMLADKLIEDKTDRPMLLYIWAHTYEFDYKPDKYKEFEKFCELVSYREDIEYCTNIKAFKLLGQIY